MSSTDASSDISPSSFSNYKRLLTQNHYYRYALLSYYIDNIGNWMTFIAAVSITDRLGGSLYTSAYLVMRLLPPFAAAPWVGPLADRINKRNGMIACSVLSALSVFFTMMFLDTAYVVWVLYVSTILMFTVDSLYSPLRSSLLPFLVDRKDLMMVTTLDGIGWSAIGAFGATLGGIVVSRYGAGIAFFMDALTYIFCAGLVWRIPSSSCEVSSASDELVKETEMKMVSGVDSGTDQEQSNIEPSEEDIEGAVLGKFNAEKVEDSPENTSNDHHFKMAAQSSKIVDGCEDPFGECGVELQPGVLTTHLVDDGSFYSMLQYIWSQSFILSLLCIAKCCGSILWGAADVVAVKFSLEPRMHTFGDEQFTMGLIFAVTGVGCQLGPLWNLCTKQEEAPLVRVLVISIAQISLSYVVLMGSTNIYGVMFGTILRSMASAVVWIYSTLLLRLLVPTRLQGRVFALERAFSTFGKVLSTIYAGYAIDVLKLSERETCGIIAVFGLLLLSLWTMAYTLQYHIKPNRLGYQSYLALAVSSEP